MEKENTHCIGNEPLFGSRSEPDARVSVSNLCRPFGEIPEGRGDVPRKATEV
jgi:hypothetical protein